MSFEEVVRLAQKRGFFFKTAESYPNSPAGFWDYGPLGVSLRNRFIELWRRMVVRRDRMVEIDGAQILPKSVFEASGHLSGFTDPIVRCVRCGSFHRPDKLIEEKTGSVVPEKLTDKQYDELLEKNGVRCPNCGSELRGTRRFNMMFRVGIGAQGEEAYLRPETCQTIFVDFPLLFKTQRIKLPVGFAQVGKSFRNEIAPRQGLLRLRELTQAEVEVFFNPARLEQKKFDSLLDRSFRVRGPEGREEVLTTEEALQKKVIPNKLVGYYLALIQDLYLESGIEKERIRFRLLSDEERAFYSRVAYDLEVKLSVGWLELVACNYRGDYDLSRHSKVSGTDFSVDDNGEKVLPHVFELSMGVDRSVYAILESSVRSEGERSYLSLRPYLAPLHAGIFPLVNKDGLQERAMNIFSSLFDSFDVYYDDSGSIGRRYARADEVGVPLCVTVDYDTLKDNTVTIRRRDSRKQERVSVEQLQLEIGYETKYPTLAPLDT